MRKIVSKKEKVLIKQLKLINKKEDNLFIDRKESFLNKKISPYKNKLEEKIPDKLQNTLQVAFEKGFNVVFKKGIKIIEKSFDKEKINEDFNINDYAVNIQTNKKNIKNIDKKTNTKVLLNKSISVLEGGILGILGIGLPDIPIFIGVILKTIYEISLGYGFSYDNDDEKIYILNIICSAMTTGEEKRIYLNEIDKIAEQIDKGIKVERNVDELIKETSNKMAISMLTSKFIQGLPIVGVVGSVTNYKTIKEISKIAKVKYKKRYLIKLK
ncbi:EcsC family protein [Clostridium botulinum]|uniref:EcsC family protein n=1 Tax=unclassified Clostridium TaxID=2614128 RepID=UPI0005055ABA|nr:MULTISPECIES: EcsC family protein [unclassified Clostridium]AIY79869.1 ecsC family protein [Clostridium botulinum 202F]KAI3347920.1 EcsC family protein [Clostridium botulinum]KFX53874.1 EcsC protein family [Clostridium botulinum]KFX57136.1 EcsC protein family [Clostridium botulinum]KON14670.1 EcsC protein family [Clostridium botulinum]